jgi:electron transport complex protein RnfG
MKNSYVKLGGVLFIIAAIAAGILAWLNDSTKDLIAKNDAMASMDPQVLEAVMPGSVMFNEYEDPALVKSIKSENEKFVNLLTAVDASDNELGYVVRTWSTVAGYDGDMELFIGFSPEGKVTGVSVITSSETEGLGSRTTEPEFTSQFAGKDASAEIVDFEAVSGATKSSNSFLSAVNNAINIYNQYLK